MTPQKAVFLDVHLFHTPGAKTKPINAYMNALLGHMVTMIQEFATIDASLALMLGLTVLPNIHGEIIPLIFAFLNAQ